MTKQEESSAIAARHKNEYNLIAALTKIGGDLMIGASFAADTARQVQERMNATFKAGEVIDMELLALANASLGVAVAAFEALSTHGMELVARNAKLVDDLGKKA